MSGNLVSCKVFLFLGCKMEALHLLLLSAGICFTDAHKFNYEPRILNGEPTSADEFPWMVSIRRRTVSTGIDFASCGATLIELDPPIILSAAHCFSQFLNYNETDDTPIFDSYGNELELYADINRTYKIINTPNDTYYSLQIYPSYIHVHPSWANPSYLTSIDLALIIFDDYNTSRSDFNLDNYNGHIPPLSTNDYIYDNNPTPQCCQQSEILQVMGYGRISTEGTYDESDSPVLRITDVEYLSINECTDKLIDLYFDIFGIDRGNTSQNLSEILTLYGLPGIDTVSELEQWVVDIVAGRPFNTYDNSVICVRNEEGSGATCNGDSGGPLFRYNHDGKAELVGVTSFVIDGCDSGFFNGYVNVASHYKWIQETINEALDYTDEPTMNPTLEPTIEPTMEPTVASSALRSYFNLDWLRMTVSVFHVAILFYVCL